MNELYEALLWSEGEEIVVKILDELDEYGQTHFSFEENIMQEENSPFLHDHIVEHNVFRQRIVEMRQKFKSGISSVDLELSAYLNGWMVNHIMKMDKLSFSRNPKDE